MRTKSYRNAFIAAIILHLVLVGFLIGQTPSKNPVIKSSPTTILSKPLESTEKVETIKAVSINSDDVMETVNRLKAEREQKKQEEQQRQLTLKKQVEDAKKQRQREQSRLEKLKKEHQRLEKARKKQLADEKRRQQIANQKKREEEKRIEDLRRQKVKMQKEQEQEEKRLAAIKKQQEEQAKKEAERRKRIEAERAAADAKRKEQIAGEVNKYKALIINAISRQWILPDNVDENLSSQFRIRLAPTGAVLDVSLTRSSGDPILDRSAQSAIYKASPLPVPKEPEAFNLFRDIRLTVRPENVRG